MITSLNRGDGTPCTITSFNKKRMDEYVSQDEVTKFSNEFSKQVKDIGKQITDAKSRMDELLDKKGALNKKEKEELKDLLYQINIQFNSNIPYIRNCFDESINDAVSEFKQLCDAKVTRTIEQVGIDVLKNKQIGE